MNKYKYFFLFIALAPSMAYAQSLKVDQDYQNTNVTTPSYLIDTIVDSNLSKEQLYNNALNYIATSFGDSRSVIEEKDVSQGQIFFNGNIVKIVETELKGKRGKIDTIREKARLYFKCKLYFKDKKFKVILNKLEFPFSETLHIDMKIPVQPAKLDERSIEKGTRELAFELIKSLSVRLNKKPENDF